MRDIDVKFLTEYYNWMLKPKQFDKDGKNIGGAGNNKYTAANNMKVIRTMFKMAIRNGDFPELYYPFKDYKIREKDRKLTTRDFLEIEEIYELEKLLHAYYPPSKENSREVTPEEWETREKNRIITPSEYRVLRRFLTACYTGLRFRDTIALDRKYHVFARHVRQKNSDEKLYRYYIELNMHKTEAPVMIPLIDKAVALIQPELREGKVFEKISNQKCNKYLKSIQQKAGIEKKLTFHVARHSFATIAFEYDIHERVVQAVLGHENRKYTEIYAHLTKRRVFLEMEKLNNAHKQFMPGKEVLEKMDESKLAKILPLLQNMDDAKLDKLADLLQVMAAA
jgi:integrase/recombinase XerD